MKFILTNTLLFLVMLPQLAMAAVDSYRFFHVTIDTPWLIFIFLAFLVLFPFVLLAILYWYFAFKRGQETNHHE